MYGEFWFDAFLSTCFLARGLAPFQQFVEIASSLDGKKQDLKIAQSVKGDSATLDLQKTSVWNASGLHDDVKLFPASQHEETSCLRLKQ